MLKNLENLPDPRNWHETLISTRKPIRSRDMLEKVISKHAKEHFWKVSFNLMDSSLRAFPHLGQNDLI